MRSCCGKRLVARLLGQLAHSRGIEAFPRLDESAGQRPQAMTDSSAALDQQDMLPSGDHRIRRQIKGRGVLLAILSDGAMLGLTLTIGWQLSPGLQIVAHARLDVVADDGQRR